MKDIVFRLSLIRVNNMDIKRYLLSKTWLWKQIEYRKERFEYDGHFPERWRYKHRILKRVSIVEKFNGTTKLQLVQQILKIYDKQKIK